MKKSAFIILPLVSLILTACEAPDIAGLNSMPKKTGEMSDMMATTKDAIHKQTLLLALVELNKRENQENIFPVPTGLMPAGEVFAEEATPEELMKLTFVELKKLEENTLITGLGADGPTALTEQEQNYSRLRKAAALSSLQIIAAFAQDEKIDQIIQHDIGQHSRFQETALQFLALRASFLRDVLLKLSLNIDSAKPETLDNSGKMNEAIKYLTKLEKISKLSDKLNIRLELKGEAAFLGFKEDERVRRLETPAMWALAIQKANDGSVAYQTNATTDPDLSAEMAAQAQAIEVMKSHLDGWK